MLPDDMESSNHPGYLPLRVSSAVRAVAVRAPDQIVIEDGDKQLTCSTLLERMNRIANVAKKHWKLRRGDVVAVIALNRAEYFEIILGLSDLGIRVATLNPRMTAEELKDVLEDCAPLHAIIDSALADAVSVTEELGVPKTLINQDYESLLSGSSPVFEPAFFPETENFAICYTSGTTGKPKGVLLSHRSRALTCMAMALEYGCFGHRDRFLLLVPMCHGAGFAFALAAVSFGGSCILFHDPSAEAIVDRLAQGDITGVFMVPTHFSRLNGISGALRSRLRSGHKLRAIISNAAALAHPLKELAVEIFGQGLLHETYGSTEAGIVTNNSPDQILKRPGSVGKPFFHTQVEIRRPDGECCAPGEIGELFSKAPYTFSGYLNRPQATSETITDGWVSVQDLASMDEDGFLSIRGRMKDMVISGGMNIYPAEIERVVEAIPGVSEAAIVGVPDPEWGEKLHAFVVSEESADIDNHMILAACREQLSTYKIPKIISYVRVLPRNASGKLLKRELRDMALRQA